MATVVVLTSADTSPWTIPADWNDADNTVEVIGPGGGGCDGTAPGFSGGAGGPGGGAGAHDKLTNATMSIVGSTPFSIGLAGTSGPFGTATNGSGKTTIDLIIAYFLGTTLEANFGLTSTDGTAGGVGGAAGGSNSRAGGSGGNGTPSSGPFDGGGGGGGGGAGGPSAGNSGSAGSGTTGGAGGQGDGSAGGAGGAANTAGSDGAELGGGAAGSGGGGGGGNGGPAFNPGSNGGAAGKYGGGGGGGGGAGRFSSAGVAGAPKDGCIIITYTPAAPPSGKLFRSASLALGAGGPFFADPLAMLGNLHDRLRRLIVGRWSYENARRIQAVGNRIKEIEAQLAL